MVGLDLTERIPLDDITRQAREVHFWRTVLTVVAAVLFSLGWVVAKAFSVAWLAAAWSAVAVREGWRQGRKTQALGPSQ